GGPKGFWNRRRLGDAGLSIATRADLHGEVRDLRRAKNLPSARATRAQRSRGNGFRHIQDRLSVSPQFHEFIAQLAERLRLSDSRPDYCHRARALADSKQS